MRFGACVDKADFTGTLTSSVTATTSATIPSLLDNTTYYGRVLSTVSGMDSGWSASASSGTLANTPVSGTWSGVGAQAVADGVSGLWNKDTESYDWAVHEDAHQTPADLTVLYPDAMEQVWAVAFGLVPQQRATSLLTRIKALHPELARPNSVLPGGDGTELVGYWTWAAAAWLATGDRVEADRLLTAIDSAAVSGGRPWPFTSGNAGQVMVLAARLSG